MKPDAYGTSIVDTTVEGVKSTSKNLFDIEWLLLMSGWSHTGGYYTGQVNANKSALLEKMNGMNIKGKRIALTLKGYTSSANRGMAWVINYTDNSTEELRMEGTTQGTWTLVSNQNKTVDHFSLSYGSGTTIDYYSAIQIEIGSIATEVVPYGTLDTLTLPQSVTLRSAGSVADTDELNVEVNGVAKRRQTTRIGTYTFTGNETWEQYTDWGSSTTWKIAVAYLPNELKQAVDGWSGEQLFPLYLSGTVSEVLGGTKNMSCILNGTSGFYICDSSITSASDCQSKTAGKVINFKLATPNDPTQLTPVIDNTIQTEGGGTINTIQNNVYPDDSPAPVIDNCLDVGYLAL